MFVSGFPSYPNFPRDYRLFIRPKNGTSTVSPFLPFRTKVISTADFKNNKKTILSQPTCPVFSDDVTRNEQLFKITRYQLYYVKCLYTEYINMMKYRMHVLSDISLSKTK